MAKQKKQIVDVAEYEGKKTTKKTPKAKAEPKPKTLNRSAAVVRAMRNLGDGHTTDERR